MSNPANTHFSPRQEEIAKVALRLVAEEGMSGLTMRRISDRIGISEPAIYRHFKNKESILELTLQNFLHAKKNEFATLRSSSLDARQLLAQAFRNRLNDFDERPDLAALIFREDILDVAPVCRQLVLKLRELHRKNIEQFIKTGQDENQIRRDIESSELAFIFIASLRSLVQEWHVKKRSFNLNSKGLTILAALVEMLRS